jgi:predicted O-methyltransferase YrrM
MTIAGVADDIRQVWSTYDHRPFLPIGLSSYYYTDKFRFEYAAFKAAVAEQLKPKTIIEIGVGVGVSALAFLYGCPTATYIGIDNDVECMRDFPVKPSEFVGDKLGDRGCIWKKDSTKIDRLPPADLVHIDGDHSYEGAYNDVMLAWRSEARWILVDDARDSVVAAATFDALRRKSPGSVDWAYFENTWTGNILISRVKERP